MEIFKISYLLTDVICLCSILVGVLLPDGMNYLVLSFIEVLISMNSKTRTAKGIVEWKNEILFLLLGGVEMSMSC